MPYEVIARYRKKGESPFVERPTIKRITNTIDDFITKKDLEKFAKKHIPRGYEFIESFSRKIASMY